MLVVPGRNPMLLAKELATLDRLSNGRLLPAFGLGAPDPGEHQAFGVERSERAKRFDEALPLLRRFWAGETVDHDGPVPPLRGRPWCAPSPCRTRSRSGWAASPRSELQRCGRLGDGWLPSFCTPDDLAAGHPHDQQVAAEHDRAIDPEHFGALIPYVDGELPDVVAAGIKARRPRSTPPRSWRPACTASRR